MRRKTRARICCVLLVCLIAPRLRAVEPASTKVQASDREIADRILDTAHAARLPKVPLECAVDFDLLDLIRVDEAKETYTIDFYVWVSWHDERLKFNGDDFGLTKDELGNSSVVIPPSVAWDTDRLWNPVLEFMNVVESKTTEQYLRLQSDGTSRYTARLTNTFKFAEKGRAFWRFPFDQQELKITVESFRWDGHSVKFTIKDGDAATQEKQLQNLETAEWRILSVRTQESLTPFKGSEKAFSEASVTVTIKRMAGFYLWRVCLPLLILVLIAMSVAWIPREQLEARMILSVTTLVAVTTFSIVVNTDLPHLPYLTLMDFWMLVSFILSACGAIENVIVANMEYHKHEQRAHQIDFYSRWVAPSIYLVATIVCLVVYL